MALGFHMPDHGLDGGAASQLMLDGAEHAVLLPEDEDRVRVRRIVATVPLVDIGALNLAPGELLGVLDRGPQRVSIIWSAGQEPRLEARTGRPGRGRWWRRSKL
jgi:hypothetical protein